MTLLLKGELNVALVNMEVIGHDTARSIPRNTEVMILMLGMMFIASLQQALLIDHALFWIQVAQSCNEVSRSPPPISRVLFDE